MITRKSLAGFETKGAQAQPRTREHRDLPLNLADVAFKASGSGAITFEGYGSVFGSVDSYGDTIQPGAFAESLKARRPVMLYGHRTDRVIGKWTSIQEDQKGLKLVGELTPGHSDAADVGASLKHGAMSGLSIGGYTTKAEYPQAGGRQIQAFDLYEISVVSMPAEDNARIDTETVKALVTDCRSLADLEAMLRDAAGFTRGAATAFVSRMRSILQGDPGMSTDDQAATVALLDAMNFELPNIGA